MWPSYATYSNCTQARVAKEETARDLSMCTKYLNSSALKSNK
ncbi:hypothetical protein LINPERPRIM_LOCUS17618 [Linum perenne]